MLGTFPLSVGIGGDRYVVIFSDIPTATFFHGFPNGLPSLPCFDGSPEDQRLAQMRQLRTWMLELVSRAAVDPVLTLEMVYRLGDSALELVVGYLHAIGWIDDAALKQESERDDAHGRAARRYRQAIGAMAEELLPVSGVTPPRYGRSHLPFVGDMAPNTRLAIREVARRAHIRPSVLWQTPISEFLLDFRLLIQDAPKAGAGITPEDAAIGFESYAS